ncbi:MAG: hypothetical protein KDB04_10780 [Acidimicrobiales bacterium]|nr:hypothetical protein [Acidimicrobiales bacterium]
MNPDSRHRLGLLAVATLSLFGALFARLWFLQIVEGDSFEAQAATNNREVVITPAPRGRILDRNGVPLVDNRESIVVGIAKQDFEELSDGKQDALVDRLAQALSFGKPVPEQITAEDIRKKLDDPRFTKFRPIPIAEDLTPEEEIYFAEQADRYPTVSVEHTTVREYPYGSLAAHVLGYVGPLNDDQWQELSKDNDSKKPYVQTDEIGRAGVEAQYESYLRGTPGQRVYEVDRTGTIVRELEKERVEPKPGDDVYLSLDVKVQYKAEEALQAQLLQRFQGRPGHEAGALVVLDPTTSQVRAMASYPTYDPSELVGGIPCPVWRDLQGLPREGPCGDDMTAEIAQRKADGDPVTPKLLNRAIRGEYFPASTFKLASGYAAIKAGIRTPETTIQDPGYERLCEGDGKGCLKRNAEDAVHGSVALAKALTVSSDVYFYKVGRQFWEQREQLGETAFQDAVKDLGYGELTGIDLPGELKGQIPTPASELELALALYRADPGAYDNDEAVARDQGRWNTGFSADIAIGQKLVVTPLQSANAYAALSNGGTLRQPTVIEKITGYRSATAIHYRPDLDERVIRQIDFKDARDDFLHGFQGVVDPTGQIDRGTAVTTFTGFPFDRMPLAGKTGTAQNGKDPTTNRERPDTSVFVGFTLGGPSSWVATATLEYSGSGGSAAAPAVRMVLQSIADGSLDAFTIPTGGSIDAESAAADAADIGTSTTD